jgi:acylpyruvate hydrolase
VRFVNFSVAGSADMRSGVEFGGEVAPTQAVADLAGMAPAQAALLDSPRATAALTPAERDGLAEVLGERAEELRQSGSAYGLGDVRLGPPIPDPPKIVCLGLNYLDHAEESGLEPPSAPIFFAKFANSLIGPTDVVTPPPDTTQVDYEAELAVVIGARTRLVEPEDALDQVAGVMALNDVSARDLQHANTLWTGGKAIDTFAPCGPALVTLDEIGDVQDLSLRTWVNGTLVQDGNTSNMIFGVAETISFLSRTMTLEPGDIIATGTPAGVGFGRDPQTFLKTDDRVEVELAGVGRLSNQIGPPFEAAPSNRVGKEAR